MIPPLPSLRIEYAILVFNWMLLLLGCRRHYLRAPDSIHWWLCHCRAYALGISFWNSIECCSWLPPPLSTSTGLYLLMTLPLLSLRIWYFLLEFNWMLFLVAAATIYEYRTPFIDDPVVAEPTIFYYLFALWFVDSCCCCRLVVGYSSLMIWLRCLIWNSNYWLLNPTTCRLQKLFGRLFRRMRDYLLAQYWM